MPKNILYIDTSITTYGGQLNLLDMVKGIDEDRYRAVIASPINEELKALSPLTRAEWIELDAASRSSEDKRTFLFRLLEPLKDIFRLNSIVKRYNIALIHAHTYKGLLLAVFAAKINRIPLIWHDGDFSQHGFLDRLVSACCDRIICVSNAVAENRAKTMDALKMVVIHNAIDFAEFSDKNDKKKIRKEFGLAEDDIVIGFVGRISPHKGLEYLVEAIGSSLLGGYNLKVIVVGGVFRPEDKGYFAKLKKMISSKRLNSRFIFAGYRTDARRIAHVFDLAVVPSVREPFGRVVVEAMASGVPLVASRSGGIPEIVEDEITGILFEPCDSVDLSRKIKLLLDDSGLGDRIVAKAKEVFKEQYTLERFARETQEVYDKLLDKK